MVSGWRVRPIPRRWWCCALKRKARRRSPASSKPSARRCSPPGRGLNCRTEAARRCECEKTAFEARSFLFAWSFTARRWMFVLRNQFPPNSRSIYPFAFFGRLWLRVVRFGQQLRHRVVRAGCGVNDWMTVGDSHTVLAKTACVHGFVPAFMPASRRAVRVRRCGRPGRSLRRRWRREWRARR